MEIYFNTPDLEIGEIDWLLQSLGFNCMSLDICILKIQFLLVIIYLAI